VRLSDIKRKEKIYDLVAQLPLADCDAVISFLEYLVDRSEKKPRIKSSVTPLRIKTAPRPTHPRIKTREDLVRNERIMASVQKNVDEYTSKPDHYIEAFKKKMDHIWRWGW